MGKEDIRQELIRKREALSQEEWMKNSRTITKNILKSKLYKQADKLFIYADFRNEVETLTLIEESLILGKEIYLPKVIEGFNESRMDFFRVSSSCELVDGYMGIHEPTGSGDRIFNYEENADQKLLMLVPGVAFDKKGNRLGYGKGYYDNYLADKPNILKVGLCFSIQVINDLPSDENDIRLDYLINELTEVKEINSFEYRK